MLVTSTAWDNAFEEQIVPETFVEVELDLSKDYSGGVTFGGTASAGFVDTSDLTIINHATSVQAQNYALLENNWWALDGSALIMDDSSDYPKNRYVANPVGVSSAVTMEVVFTTKITDTIPGITVYWDDVFGEYPKNFFVRVWNGGTLVEDVTVTDNDKFYTFVEMEISNFDCIQVIVNSWSKPNRRVRICGLCLGAKLVFGKDDLCSYSYEQTGDPVCSEMTTCTVEFSLDNSDGRWDLMNRTGLSKYLAERQTVNVRYGVDVGTNVEWIQAAKVYLSEWRVPSGGLEATFVARDRLSFSDNKFYERGYVTGKTTASASFYKTSELGVNGDTSSGSCVSGQTVRILETGSYYINNDTSDSGNLVHTAYRTNMGWVNSSVIEITQQTEANVVFNSALNLIGVGGYSYAGSIDLLNTTPMPLIIQKTLAYEVAQMCLNACGYSVWFSNDGQIHIGNAGIGTPLANDVFFSQDCHYSEPEIDLAKPISSIDVVKHDVFNSQVTTVLSTFLTSGVTITVDNPYVLTTSPNASNLAAKMKTAWEGRAIISGSVRPNPKFELFDIVGVETKYGKFSITLTSIKYTYNGAFQGSYVGRKLGATT